MVRRLVREIETSDSAFLDFVLTFAFGVAGAQTIAFFTGQSAASASLLVYDAAAALAAAATVTLIVQWGARVSVRTAAQIVLGASVLVMGAPLVALVARDAIVTLAIMLVVCAAAVFEYVRIACGGIARSAVTSVLGAGAIGALVAMPRLLAAAPRLVVGSDADHVAAAVSVFVAGGGCLMLAWRADPRRFRLLVADSRWPKVAHFAVLLVVGVMMGIRTRPHRFRPGFPSAAHLIDLALFIVAGVLASVFSTITNNIEDTEIDRISNAERPHVAQILDVGWYRAVGYWCLAAALLAGAVVGIPALLVVLAGSGNYFFYSVRPLKLKRLPILSKFLIAVNSLLVLVAGFAYVRGSTTHFPPAVVFFVLVAGTIAINVLDIKDYEGDRQAGIRTLPVLLGPALTKRLSATATVLMYASTLVWLGNPPVAIALTSVGVLQAFLMTRPRFDERRVTLLYLAGILIVVGYYGIQ